MRVFVLIFNPGTDNEGIHSIRVGDQNQILMFESEDDANRFAMMLEAQDFPTPTVEAIDDAEIKEFCAAANFDYQFVPADGTLVIPPENNVETTDWDPNQPPSQPSISADDGETEYSDSELDRIRRQLEGLL
ncbi:DUF3110 domain-containing protein [Calothrix sp. NIES-3974]|uniref:DUF3110 domain-containing protein n=1 Tax=Calothrix sp. NIES-3974 TaxID=2005462 RepID=UPI000B5E0BFB|nr:DUF3110 domain-containing protein [Calothrix sp. NIES-3974]BAZ07990.1 hypothetical protein NIES3974_46580 [Calothrix sp. NIES-3974]